MKAFIFILAFFSFLLACERDRHYNYEIKDGIYMGIYYYQNKIYYSEIEVDSNKYEEWPSGGFIYQKSDDCLTIGRFSITENILSFKQDSFKYGIPHIECNPDMVLNGDFNITVFGDSDSIIFNRGRGIHSIYYHLKKR